MKSKLKYLFSMFSVMLLTIMLSLNTYAEDTYTITINNSASGHTYEAYQIFTGDLAISDGNKVLSNIEWGDSVTGYGSYTSALSAAESIKVDSNATENSAVAGTDLSNFLNNITLSATAYKSTSTLTDGKYEITGLAPGYYLIKDQNTSLNGDENEAYTSYIIKVVRDVESSPKSAIPSSYKKVKDADDTAGTTSGWQDSADYDIGDSVPFQLTGIVADNYANYSTYKFIFHDKLSDGLTFKSSSVKAYLVNGDTSTEISSSNYTISETGSSTETFAVTFANLKSIDGITAGSKIVVEYDATLNDSASIGAAGNPNKMYLEYSNNPNQSDGSDTGKTPEDTVVVFTYKLIVDKVNNNDSALTGAEFSLVKTLSDGTTKDYTVVMDESGTRFTVTGLDDGTYVLTETKTPAGYNTIDPVTFTVAAGHDTEADAPALTSLTGTDNAASNGITFTASSPLGALSTKVTNVPGTILPETGGLGTRILYALGFFMMIFAVCAAFMKKGKAKH